MVAIEPHVIEGGRVARPHHRSGRIRHDVGEIGAGCEIADAHGEELRAGFVGRPGEQAMVGRMAGCRRDGNRPCRVRAHRRRAGSARRSPDRCAAADQRMLPALAIAHGIGIRPVGRRHAGIVFLDAAPHLGEQQLLQRRRFGQRLRPHRRSRLPGRRGSPGRAWRDRASPPASSRPQPSKVVDQRDAVPGPIACGLGSAQRRSRNLGTTLEHFIHRHGSMEIGPSWPSRRRCRLADEAEAERSPAEGSGRRRREGERRAVHTVTLPGRIRAVGKHVAEMSVAVGAADLGAPHEPGAVLVLAHRVRLDRRPEARPAGAGVEFRRRRRTTARRSTRSRTAPCRFSSQ